MEKSDWAIAVETLPEDMPVRGNAVASGNDEEDREIEDGIINDLETGDEWAWCTVAVTVRFRDYLEHTEYLGGCSYASRQDFVDNSGYYEDMVETCKEAIRTALARLTD